MCFGKVPQKEIVKAFDVSLIYTPSIVLTFPHLQPEPLQVVCLIFMVQLPGQ